MFISFEGIDGCGKSTQVHLLEQELLARGKEVLVLREPGATELSEHIRSILLRSTYNIDPVAELLLFCASRRQLVEQIIRPALERGAVVICDRYIDSSTAYQGYGRGVSLIDVDQANQLATGGLLPSKTIILDIAVDISYQRRGKRIDVDRIESAGTHFFENVRSGYMTITQQNPERVRLLDGTSTIENLHKRILEIVL